MDILLMKRKEINRIEILEKRKQGSITQEHAAIQAGISTRQMRRLEKRYKTEGGPGLIHRSRGKPSLRRLDPELKKRIIQVLKDKYKDFGPTLAAEMLHEHEGIKVSSQTTWRYMVEEGLWQKSRKHNKHRKWREPKKYYGQMHQLDGSIHDWFEGRGPQATLIKFIDDATSTIMWAEFVPSESLVSVMGATKNNFEKNGRPHALYTDKGSVYKVNGNNEEDEFITQFERMMEDLDVTMIHARSPQAKGRVERGFRTDQDRLVKQLRLRNISTIQAANKFLVEHYIPQHNRKFARPAAAKGDVHRSLKGINLEDVLVTKNVRVVQNDWTIQYNNRIFQLTQRSYRVRPKDKVLVCERLDGSIYIWHRNVENPFEELAKKPEKQRAQKTHKELNRHYKPAKEHPWRRTNSLLFR